MGRKLENIFWPDYKVNDFPSQVRPSSLISLLSVKCSTPLVTPVVTKWTRPTTQGYQPWTKISHAGRFKHTTSLYMAFRTPF